MRSGVGLAKRLQLRLAPLRRNYLKLMSAYLFRPPGGGRNADDGGVVSAGDKLWHIAKLYARCSPAGAPGRKRNTETGIFFER